MKRYKKASDIKVGVVGYGGAFHMGRGHLEQMRAAGMTPTAACDTDPARMRAAADDFPGIETYPSAKAMLKSSDVDLVALVTPHNTHAPLALACLNSGRHVICEKPMALTTAECDRMIAAAKKNGVVLSTYHNRHWDGCIVHALRKIRSGAIGDVVRVEAHMGGWGRPGDWWRSSKSRSGGILYDWGVHLLEYVLQIVEADILEVSGFAKTGFWAPETVWKGDTNEDEAFGVVRFAGGAWATLMISNIDSRPKEGQLEITGTKGTYLFTYNTWEMITHKRGETVITKGQNPPSHWENYYKNIVEHLTKGGRLVITPEWARRPIHILDLASRSAVKGTSLKAKYK